VTAWEDALLDEVLAQVAQRKAALRWWRCGDPMEREAAMRELADAIERLDRAERRRQAIPR
jgi:hypothetical protein